ncbi:MAG TPA: RluA family pseudouridine synthase, partial [Clostridia bacterium]|nr:RluA family pseudouridine synthase [Clostridia bacterium]
MSGELVFVADRQGERLDSFLARASGISRAQIQHRIAQGAVLVDGALEKPSYKLSIGAKVLLAVTQAKALDVTPEEIALDIIYQDKDFAIINKAQGMVVHPAPGNPHGTLVNALLFALDDLSGIGGVLRPGIVHRLDKMTSGLLIIAKNDYAHGALAAQFKAQTVCREYLALV